MFSLGFNRNSVEKFVRKFFRKSVEKSGDQFVETNVEELVQTFVEKSVEKCVEDCVANCVESSRRAMFREIEQDVCRMVAGWVQAAFSEDFCADPVCGCSAVKKKLGCNAWICKGRVALLARWRSKRVNKNSSRTFCGGC